MVGIFIKPLLWLVFIMVLCLMPPQDLPQMPGFQLPFFDKIVHSGMYFIFSLLMVRPLRIMHWPVWPVTLAASLIVGGLIEILQYTLTSFRSASWGDFAADTVGAAAGILTPIKS